MNKQVFNAYFIIISTLVSLCLFILLILFVTELDIKNIEKQEEYQKLLYYQTLNKTFKEE